MLNLRSVISCNINGTPLYSCNLSKRIDEYKNFIDESSKENISEDDLVIISIQGLYGYRTGILGYLSNMLSYRLSKNNNPKLLKSLLNVFISSDIESNDFEICSFILSMISRKLPLLNIGNWDLKKNINNNYINNFIPNHSLPSIFDLKSVYLLNPIFDSGCTIISNKECNISQFERWEILDHCNFKNKLFNKGINWAYYESKDKQNGITIINFELIESTDEDLISQFRQLVNLKNKLEIMFANNIDNLKFNKYETIITGDFKL